MKKKNNRKVRRIIIRLYRQFDIDLIYAFEMMKKSGSEPQSLIKNIIRQYISGEYKPGRRYAFTESLLHPSSADTLVLRRKIQYHVLLDEIEDGDILGWIEGITLGYRNTVVKGLIRGFIGEPCIYPCLVTTNLRFTGKDAKCLSGEEKEENNF